MELVPSVPHSRIMASVPGSTVGSLQGQLPAHVCLPASSVMPSAH